MSNQPQRQLRMFLGMPRESIWSTFLQIHSSPVEGLQLIVTAGASCWWGSSTFVFLKGHPYVSVMSQIPPDFPMLSVLASYCEGVFSINIMKLFLCLAGKHVPTTGKPENRFSWFFFFFPPDQQGPARFPRDSFLFIRRNCNTELQVMKVIALTFQLANEDTAQML